MKSELRLLLRQAKMDFRRRYLGTLLGGTWAFVSPLTSIVLIYFVFSYGLKTSMMGNVSFVHWFVPAMMSWSFISESISLGCNAILESSYLVTKVVYPVWTLPIAKVLSALPVHILLMCGFIITLVVGGVGTPISWIQLVYYLFCSCILCMIIAFFSASLMVFVRDVMNIVAVVLQLLFWATPIFWDPAMIVGTKFHWLLLSPFNYIIQGYRDSLFGGLFFWERPIATAFFWGVVFLLGGASVVLYRRIRPHFADVL